MIIQLSLGLLAFLALIFSLFGDTWHPQNKWPKKLSITGWVILLTAILTVSLNSYLVYTGNKKSNWITKSVYARLLYPLYTVSKLDEKSAQEKIDASCKDLRNAYAKVSGSIANDFVVFSTQIAAIECGTDSDVFEFAANLNLAICYICNSSDIYKDQKPCQENIEICEGIDEIINYEF